MPPRVDDGIGEAVGEPENGQRTSDGELNAPAAVGRLVPITGDVHAAGDEVGHPSDVETAAGEKHHLDGLPLGQRFIGARGRRRRRRETGDSAIDGRCCPALSSVSKRKENEKKAGLFSLDSERRRFLRHFLIDLGKVWGSVTSRQISLNYLPVNYLAGEGGRKLGRITQ